ncbi:MAG: glycoside hydrolase family 5 protein [Acidimicrobiia bacterium]
MRARRSFKGFGVAVLATCALVSAAVLGEAVSSSAGWAGPTTRTSAAAVPAFAIRVSGNHLVDARGVAVQLHGVDRSGTEYACVQGWGIFDGPHDLSSVRAISAWDVNAVRVPLNEDCWLGINGVKAAYGGASYRKAIVQYVNLLNSQGIYVILDLHWSAPGATPATGQNPMPDQDHSPAFWRGVASTFKTHPAVLFDLFNEPYPDNNNDSNAAWTCLVRGGTCRGVSYQTAGMQELISTVRATGATNVIMVGGVQYANAMDQWLTHEPHDPAHQLAASVHDYNSNSCSSLTCWQHDYAPVAAHVPLIAGEIGESDGTGAFVTHYLSWADEHAVSYLAWTWDTWGCSNGPVLISSYSGQACPGYGATYRAHLLNRP